MKEEEDKKKYLFKNLKIEEEERKIIAGTKCDWGRWVDPFILVWTTYIMAIILLFFGFSWVLIVCFLVQNEVSPVVLPFLFLESNLLQQL